MKVLFFLLAGGYGKRARPLSSIKPKPAFPLDGTPLITIMLDQLERSGLNRGIISLHWLPDAIRQCARQEERPGVTFVYEKELSGSQILTAALDSMADEDLLLVVNGDIFLEIPFQPMMEELLKDHADGILLVKENNSTEGHRYRA
ncbi:MAG: NTP transferase domain-containing protein, partial [bacterium]|nr:NTP transferase domain-containing protein [bacterium]